MKYDVNASKSRSAASVKTVFRILGESVPWTALPTEGHWVTKPPGQPRLLLWKESRYMGRVFGNLLRKTCSSWSFLHVMNRVQLFTFYWLEGVDERNQNAGSVSCTKRDSNGSDKLQAFSDANMILVDTTLLGVKFGFTHAGKMDPVNHTTTFRHLGLFQSLKHSFCFIFRCTRQKKHSKSSNNDVSRSTCNVPSWGPDSSVNTNCAQCETPGWCLDSPTDPEMPQIAFRFCFRAHNSTFCRKSTTLLCPNWISINITVRKDFPLTCSSANILAVMSLQRETVTFWMLWSAAVSCFLCRCGKRRKGAKQCWQDEYVSTILADKWQRNRSSFCNQERAVIPNTDHRRKWNEDYTSI